mmetsp:Transcript_17538/g.38236  ORF Transcript_17538/g.38236 Transcript_17538/m.38236 type:complete len:650 (+) Transcript_17538:164-2113(+)
MKLISTLTFSAIAHLLPAQFAVAKHTLRGGHTSTTWPHERTEGIISDATEPPNPEVFEAAISLDDFKNIDPELFEWVNPDEIRPGDTTCGFLKAPLGWEVEELDVVYPIVKTYVCVTFATQQPAPRGNLAVHCGGPGGLSLCNYAIWLDLDEEARSTYNIIGFDQRGMGRSEPTFVVPECAAQLQDTEGKLAVNYNDEESIRDAAKVYKEVHLNCWNHPGFKLEAIQGDGTSRAFHFLEYSGTRQLAEDIERIRRLFGDQKLSVYGISYGTVVMGSYATVFSDNVNLMVLDGSVDPNSDIVSRTKDDVRSKQQRLDYFIASCEFGNVQCGAPDVRQCINDVNRLVDWAGDEFEDWLSPFKDLLEIFGLRMYANKGIVMMILIQVIFGAYNQMSALCDAAKADDIGSFKDWIFNNLFGDNVLELEMTTNFPILNITQDNVTHYFEYNSESKPTSGQSPESDWPFQGYGQMAGVSSVCQDMITAQDMAFGPYDEDRYVKFFQELNEQYSGAGTQLPVRNSAQWYSSTYYWPNITPLPPIGNPFLKGIIAGQLYDPATPYIWTQKMRDQFDSASLLTSRSVNHGLSSARESVSADRRCFANILRYFKNGYIDFNDGKMCESDHIGDSCTIGEILTNGRCTSANVTKNVLAIE